MNAGTLRVTDSFGTWEGTLVRRTATSIVIKTASGSHYSTALANVDSIRQYSLRGDRWGWWTVHFETVR